MALAESAAGGPSAQLAAARQLYAQKAWQQAHAAFTHADAQQPLTAPDLWQVTWCCGLIGREREMVDTLERIYHVSIEAADALGAARSAFWAGYRLLPMGEASRSSGWFVRAERAIAQAGCECVEQGYLLLPEMRRQFLAGDYAAAQVLAQRAERIAEQFSELDLCVFARNFQGRLLLRLGQIEAGLKLQALVDTHDGSEQVIVAMSGYQEPRIPELAKGLAPNIQQLHSSEYQRPAQLREGAVLIVGAGNSGAEIGLELAKRQRRVWVSGPDTGRVPFRITGFLARWLLVRLMFRVVFHRILTIRTPMGRKARPKMLHAATPLIRTQTQDLIAAGAERCGRVTGSRGGRPVLEDGTVLEVTNVIWCSGYSAGFSWIDLPIFDDRGDPEHVAGVVPSQPGLYFVGLPFLYAMSSSMIHGVGRDAQRIVAIVAQRARTASTFQAA